MAAIGSEAPTAGRREWVGLAVLALPCALYSMDLTVLNLAVPRISAELRPTSTQLLWILDIYGFLVAGLLITMGSLGDRIGRRRLLLGGAAAFGVASVLAAFSTSASMLIATRAVLGIAGATIAPSTLSLIRNMFLDPRQRSVAIGFWITSYSAGAVVGPLVGGVLLEHFWWGSVFLSGVPVMALLLVLGLHVLPEFRDPRAGRPDLLSVALSLAAVLAVIFGLKQVAQDGVSPLAVLAIGFGLSAAAVFLYRQRRLADPLIDLGLFRTPAFSASLATYALATFVAFGIFLFIAQYLQLVLGLSPLQAGLCMVPGFSGFILGSMLAPKLAAALRPASVMAVGLVTAGVGFLLLTQLRSGDGLAVLVLAYAIFSLGLAPVFTLATDLIVGSATPERAGAAAAVSETASELGGALGIAILGSIGTAVYRAEMARGVPAGIGPDATALALDTLGGAVHVAGLLPDQLGTQLLVAARDAFVNSVELTAATSAIMAIALALTTAVLLRGIPAGAEPDEALATVAAS